MFDVIETVDVTVHGESVRRREVVRVYDIPIEYKPIEPTQQDIDFMNHMRSVRERINPKQKES